MKDGVIQQVGKPMELYDHQISLWQDLSVLRR